MVAEYVPEAVTCVEEPSCHAPNKGVRGADEGEVLFQVGDLIGPSSPLEDKVIPGKDTAKFPLSISETVTVAVVCVCVCVYVYVCVAADRLQMLTAMTAN